MAQHFTSEREACETLVRLRDASEAHYDLAEDDGTYLIITYTGVADIHAMTEEEIEEVLE